MPWKLVANRLSAAAHVSIRFSLSTGMLAFSIQSRSAGRLSSGTRSISGGSPGETPISIILRPVRARSVPSAVSSTSASDAATAASIAGVRHSRSSGSRWMVPNR